MSEPSIEAGWVAPELIEEFPGLGLRHSVVGAGTGRSPREVKERLRILSDRFAGAQAINMRHQPIPWAYRVFYRQIGLDPDRTRTAIEQLTLERLEDGGFRTHGLPADALNIAIAETGVALRAFDAEAIEGRLCIRDSAPGEALAGAPGELQKGTLTIADEARPIGLLFGATAERFEVERATRRIALAAVQVKGVPQIAVEEALWMAASTLEAA